MPTSARPGVKREPRRFFAGRVRFFILLVGADDSVRPLKCFEFASDFRKNGRFRWADRVVRPYGGKWEIGTGLSYPVCRGGRLCPPSKFVDFSWPFVGADAHIGPLKCCDFASVFRKNGRFPRADRVVRPYGGKWEIGTGSPENRHKTTISCGSMWASTPTARNGKPARHCCARRP